MNSRMFLRVILAAFFTLLAIPVFSQTIVDNLMPTDARSVAMGGSSLVFADGYGALWGNPAGLARKKSITLLNTSTWAYLRPTPKNINAAFTMMNQGASPNQVKAYLDGLIAENGFGAGESLGFGWVESGIGLGLTSITDACATGTSLTSSILDIKSQTNAVVGMAWMMNLGPFRFDFGAAARGYYRIETSPAGWSFSPIVDALTSGSNLYSIISGNAVQGGFGVSIDAGATLSFGPAAIGFMVRDIADKVALKTSTIKEIADSYMVPSGGLDYYSIDPIYTAGLAFSVGRGTLLATNIYMEADDPLSLISLFPDRIASISSKLRSGMEIEFLKFLSLRAGFNQGYFSFGAGMHILFLEVNAAVFTRPINLAGGTIGRSGIMVQGAIRF